VLAVFGTLRGLFPPSGGLRGNAGSGWVGYEGQPVANSGSGLLILVRQIARIHKIRTSENGVWDGYPGSYVRPSKSSPSMHSGE
jgi:hypothetical protein